MKKLTFLKIIFAGLSASQLLLAMPWSYAQVADPHKGKYELVTPSQPTTAPDKVEVVGLFWYRCPHCYSFEKNFLTAWLKKKPEYVEFLHMPAVFKNDRWVALAKAYYTAEALGVLDKIHVPLFEAIHVQKRDMNTEKAIEEFFVSLGVKSEDFTKTFSSFSIATKIRHAEEMTERYGITGVPAVIVNGKYRLSSEMTDGYENMLRVIDYLIEKEKVIMEAERKAKAVESMAPQGDKPASSVSPAADSPVKK